MKRKEIQVGKTYRSKTGQLRKVEELVPYGNKGRMSVRYSRADGDYWKSLTDFARAADREEKPCQK